MSFWDKFAASLKLWHVVKPTIYCAGPMTGYPLSNFPAFDAARDALTAQGYDVVSPADLDRKIGMDPTKGLSPPGYEEHDHIRWRFNRSFMRNDLRLVSEVDFMFFLRGWEKSRGARAEYAAACFYRDLCGGKPQLLFQEGAAKGLAFFPAEEVVHP